jgi:hypothetical protein
MMSAVQTAKTMTVIAVESLTGTGEDGDPYRKITEYFTLEGELLATVDAWQDSNTRKIFESVAQKAV